VTFDMYCARAFRRKIFSSEVKERMKI